MGGTRWTAEAGEAPAGFRVHAEAGRGRGSLAAVLFVPAEPAEALSRALASLHGDSLDLEARLGRLAGVAPGTAFLVGLGSQAWVMPSEQLRVRRVRSRGNEPLDEPQVVTLRPGERVEALAGDVLAGALALAPGPATLPPERPRRRRLPRLQARPLATVAGALAILVVAAVLVGRRDRAPREDAWAAPDGFEERVVGLLADGARTSDAKPEPERAAVPPPEPVEAAPADAPGPWRFEAGGPITSSPLVVAGRVVFGCRDSTLYCLDAASGRLEWKLAAGAGVGSSPREAAGTCFVGTYAGAVLACDLETGALRWRASTKGKIVSSPCVEAGRVVIGSYDHAVHAFDAATGAPAWRAVTGSRVRASPEPIGEGVVAVGSTDGTLYALAATDGGVRWKRRTPSAILAAAAWDRARGRVVAGTQDGTVLCLDAATGDVVWKASLGAEVNAQPTVTERVVAVGTGKGRLHALDPETGKGLWEVSAERGFDARPLVLGGSLVAPSYDGVVHLVTLADGTVTDRRPLGAGVYSSPAPAGDLVLIGTLGGTLQALALP